jgi:hypothetical protein
MHRDPLGPRDVSAFFAEPKHDRAWVLAMLKSEEVIERQVEALDRQ